GPVALEFRIGIGECPSRGRVRQLRVGAKKGTGLLESGGLSPFSHLRLENKRDPPRNHVRGVLKEVQGVAFRAARTPYSVTAAALALEDLSLDFLLSPGSLVRSASASARASASFSSWPASALLSMVLNRCQPRFPRFRNCLAVGLTRIWMRRFLVKTA